MGFTGVVDKYFRQNIEADSVKPGAFNKTVERSETNEMCHFLSHILVRHEDFRRRASMKKFSLNERAQ